MRLQFPARIPLQAACAFAGVLFVVQLAQGTDLLFSICCFLFIIISTAAFNTAGGFYRPSGAYIFFFAMLAVIVGLCTKAIVGEAGDSNLQTPQRTIIVYLLSSMGLYAAVSLARKVSPKKGLLQDLVDDRNMQNATVGCLVMGFILHACNLFIPRGNGSILSALVQIDRFFPLAIILGVIYQIRKSGGTSSINLPVLLAGADILYVGLFGFSKEGMFTPLACWVVAASSQRYKIGRLQAVGLAAVFVFMFVYMVPYSQYGRNYEIEGNPEASRTDTVIYLLSNLALVRDQYKKTVEGAVEEKHTYFNTEVGFMNRLQMISVDDELISTTERTGPYGLLPIYRAFGNLVPHALWPSKPPTIGGNAYAHEIGSIIPDDDDSTGISFSPAGEAYHLERWYGVIFLAPILWFMLFTLFDSLCGNIQAAPWGLLMVVQFGHMAPEGMLGGIIYAMGFLSFGILVAAFSAAYLMPILGSLFKGPEKSVLIRKGPIRSFQRRERLHPEPDSAQ